MADGRDKVNACPRPYASFQLRLPAEGPQLPVAGPGTEPASRGTGGFQPERDEGLGWGSVLYVVSHVRWGSVVCVSVVVFFSEIKRGV